MTAAAVSRLPRSVASECSLGAATFSRLTMAWISALGRPIARNRLAVPCAAVPYPCCSCCRLDVLRRLYAGQEFLDGGIDRVLAVRQMVEVEVGRGDAGMTEQALQLLQRVAKEPAIGRAGNVLVLLRLAEPLPDQQCQHVHRDAVT